MLAAIAHVLHNDLKLSSLNARAALPGEGLQRLHVDWRGGVAPGDYYVCNSIWLLDDFTAENGATRVVPGSHRSGKAPKEEMPDPTKPVLKAIPVQPGEEEANAPSPAPVPTDTVTTVVKPSGSPVEVRRAIPIARPTPQASEPEVRRAQPMDEDESN